MFEYEIADLAPVEVVHGVGARLTPHRVLRSRQDSVSQLPCEPRTLSLVNFPANRGLCHQSTSLRSKAVVISQHFWARENDSVVLAFIIRPGASLVVACFLPLGSPFDSIRSDCRVAQCDAIKVSTRWTTVLSSKANLPGVINFKA